MSTRKTKTTNLFLTKGANIEDMISALPKQTVVTGFQITSENTIEYIGNPKAFRFVIPIMVNVIENVLNSNGFKVVRTPKTYKDKDGTVKTKNVTTFTFEDLVTAKIICENVNNLCKAQYEKYLADKKNK